MDGASLRDAFELLRRARQQQGVDPDVTPAAAPEAASDSYRTPQDGLLGRLLALHAGQAGYQPSLGNSGSPPLATSDPNFRQLARRPISQIQGADGPSDQPSSRSRPSDSPSDGNPLGSPNPSPQGAGAIGAYGDRALPPRMMTTAQLALPGIGLPIPPPVPVPVPPIPMPAIPESWKTAWKFLQFYPRIISGMRGGGNDGEDDCYERAAKEGGRCWARNDDYAHRDFLHGCLERAVHRRNLCVSNGGRPDPMEPPEWGLADEEIWRNHHR